MKRKSYQAFGGPRQSPAAAKRQRAIMQAQRIPMRLPRFGYAGTVRTGPGPERKFIDISSNPGFVYNTVATNGAYPTCGVIAMTVINPVAQGTDANTRIGRKILMKSIFIRQEVIAATTTPASITAPGFIRTIVLFDSQTNAALPAANTVLQYTVVANAIDSPLNLDNRERYKVIWDKKQRLDLPATGPGNLQTKLYKKCNYPVVFNAGSAGTIADIQTGAIIVLTMTSCQSAVAAPLQCGTTTRVRFIDD